MPYVKRGFILDASALLAVMLNEPGHEHVRTRLHDASIHTVNVAEVVHKLAREGLSPMEVQQMIGDLGLDTYQDLSIEQATEVGGLLARTRKQGYSLGDCVCLVIGMWMGSIAVTADRKWKELDGNVTERGTFRVEVIR